MLILAVAIGAVAVILVLRLWIVLRTQEVIPRECFSLLVVAGSGGHTMEILRLVGSLSNAYSPRHYIIADTDKMSASKIKSFESDRAEREPSTMYTEYHIHQIPRSREVQQSWLSTVLTTMWAIWFSFPMVFRIKPDLYHKWLDLLLSSGSYAASRRTACKHDCRGMGSWTWNLFRVLIEEDFFF
ncbi:UDP-N-acetylglucosamine transferase subunit ALG14 isoform X2 [Dipodomys merriami]|uniref:UDP-N-acetylglucosamine transferase subunit ALG14 isoform X2 n=1 Tax=Dipodomys merriami TaxID=94247 RepID=UPI003855D1B3